MISNSKSYVDAIIVTRVYRQKFEKKKLSFFLAKERNIIWYVLRNFFLGKELFDYSSFHLCIDILWCLWSVVHVTEWLQKHNSIINWKKKSWRSSNNASEWNVSNNWKSSKRRKKKHEKRNEKSSQNENSKKFVEILKNDDHKSKSKIESTTISKNIEKKKSKNINI